MVLVMPAKVSEKKLAFGILYMVIGVIVLLNTSVINTPVRVSEKGILFVLLAFVFIGLGIRSFKRAVLKV